MKLALEDEGWTVEEAATGEEAIEAFEPPAGRRRADRHHAARHRRVRAVPHDPPHSDVPIVMVTARNDTHDIVAGLEAGADDYLTKPFAPKELSARIRALLRRIRPAQLGHERLVFGDLEMIPEEGKVIQAGEEVHLTKTEFRLLCELALNRGKVFSREELLDRVWELRLLRRRSARRRPHPPAAHQGRGRPGQPPPRRHRPGPGVPAAV